MASQEGVLVNQHLGEAAEFHVYEHRGDGYVFVETREAPGPGAGAQRWRAVGDLLADCVAILVSSAGPKPKRLLAGAGLEVHETNGLIEEALDAIYQVASSRNPETRSFLAERGRTANGTGLLCG